VLRSLRLTAWAEALTYVVLLVVVVDHRVLEGPDRVRTIGLAHGVVFLAYLAAVLGARRQRRWSAPQVVTLLAAAFLPGGTVLAERQARTRPTEGDAAV
jgi:integral membrane protein